MLGNVNYKCNLQTFYLLVHRNLVGSQTDRLLLEADEPGCYELMHRTYYLRALKNLIICRRLFHKQEQDNSFTRCFEMYHYMKKVLKGALSDCLKCFQTFWDFAIRRKLIFFLLPLVNLTAEKQTIWKILMKICLVMVTRIKLIQ